MEKLMALYNISSPSGKEGKIAGFIIGELRRMGIPFRQDRYGNIYAVKSRKIHMETNARTMVLISGKIIGTHCDRRDA